MVAPRDPRCLFFALVLFLAVCNAQDMFKASQCFKSRGIPKVAFNCDANNMIKIDRAFHGIAVKDREDMDTEEQCSPRPAYISNNCTYCQGDCIDDSMNLVYDWSTCMGNTSCIRTVMQSYMPSCPGRDKFSDYLQVEYQCVPKPKVINICSHFERQNIMEGFIMSPNYPNNYPTNMDCLCRIYTDWNSKIILSMYDLLLETKNGRCRADWLMLRQKDQKHRHCGAIMTGTKNITSATNSIEIQFHTDENDNRTQNFQYFTRSLKGFWLYFTAEPRANLQVACRQLTQQDFEVKEIQKDDAEFEEVMETKGDDAEVTKPPPKKEDEEPEKEKAPLPNTPPNVPAKIPKEKKRRPKNGPNGVNRQQNANSFNEGLSGSAQSVVSSVTITVASLLLIAGVKSRS